jgi:hypothetical protein
MAPKLARWLGRRAAAPLPWTFGLKTRVECLTTGAGRAPCAQPKKGGGMYISVGAAIIIVILLIIFVF